MSLAGKIAYNFIYRPLSLVKYVAKFGGLINVIKMEIGKRAMKSASENIFYEVSDDNAAQVFFLTGQKYWHLTAYCFYSLVKASKQPFQPVFVDDGSFDKDLIKRILKQFPGCVVKTSKEIESNIKAHLPADKFPILNHKRKTYPHIRKLTDIHAGSSGWKLVLDSDMLFFSEPVDINNWLKAPEKPFFLHDTVSSYHYNIELMERLAGHSIFDKINVGAAGFKSEDINWHDVERWIGELEKKQEKSYLLEQALSAMLSTAFPIIADKNQYIVMPCDKEVKQPSAALHHYVAKSKEWYYKLAWRLIA